MNTSIDIQELNIKINAQSGFVDVLFAELNKQIVGQRYMLERLLIGLLSNGHVLLEGVPGLAKTLAIKSLAQSIGGKFSRIQFTPDLLPADLVGTMIYNLQQNQFHTTLTCSSSARGGVGVYCALTNSCTPLPFLGDPRWSWAIAARGDCFRVVSHIARHKLFACCIRSMIVPLAFTAAGEVSFSSARVTCLWRSSRVAVRSDAKRYISSGFVLRWLPRSLHRRAAQLNCRGTLPLADQGARLPSAAV